MWKNTTAILACIVFLLFLIPNLLWYHGAYNVGGDDTMLYYMFPWEMLHNYVFNIISSNGLSGLGDYLPQWYQFPFFVLVGSVKYILPHFNTQLILYGFNLALGFLFFYILLGIWIKNKNTSDFSIKVAGGLLYVFSIFSFYTLWTGLFILYIIPVFPLIIYLLFKGIDEKKLHFIILADIIFSVFSILLLSVPWLVLGVLAIIPLAFLLFWEYKLRFVLYISTFVLILFLLNFYWIIHFLYPLFHPTTSQNNIISSYATIDFKSNAESTIRAVTLTNELTYPLFNLFHKKIQQGSATYPIFTFWNEKFLIPFAIFLLCIIFAGLRLKQKDHPLKKLYIASFLSWLTLIYFFTVKIGENIGVSLFVFLIRYIPGFVMFRNNYGKISPALPFIYALLLAISLKILFDSTYNKKIKKLILFFIILVTLLNAKPFIFSEYYSLPLGSTKNTYLTIKDLNPDFYDLSSYLKQKNFNTNIAWLPMTVWGYVLIQDSALPNHYYSGLSPIQFLAKKTDIAGLAVFPSGISPHFRNALVNRNYTEVGKDLQKLNVNYLIVNNNITPDLAQSYLFSMIKTKDLFDLQDQKLKNAILGKKLMSFGKRYDLYEINDIYKSNKIFLSENKSAVNRSTSNISIKKVAVYQYNITIKNITSTQELMFLDPYNEYWQLKTPDMKYQIPLTNHTKIFTYANGWTINPEAIKKGLNSKYYIQNKDGSVTLNLILYFMPETITHIGYTVSTIVGILCVLYLLCMYTWIGFVQIKKHK